jgi:hypothetical protein
LEHSFARYFDAQLRGLAITPGRSKDGQQEIAGVRREGTWKSATLSPSADRWAA